MMAPEWRQSHVGGGGAPRRRVSKKAFPWDPSLDSASLGVMRDYRIRTDSRRAGRSLRTRVVLLCVLCGSSSPVSTQELGREEYCSLEEEENCLAGDLAIRFEVSGENTLCVEDLVGEQIDIAVTLDVPRCCTNGWSYAVSHDPDVLTILPDSVSLQGTDAEAALLAPFFDMTQAVESDGESPVGFISAVVLGFGLAWLPEGDDLTLCRATYHVERHPGAEASWLRFESERLRNAPSPAFAIGIDVDGGPLRPQALVHGVLLSEEEACGRSSGGLFLRSDVDADDSTSLADALLLLHYLFQQGSAPPCRDAADVDDNGRLDVADALMLLAVLFQGRARPASWDWCLRDNTEDALGCEAFGPCT